MNAKEKARLETIEQLQELIKPGDTIYTKLVHVSASGMFRVISLYIIKDNQPHNIDWLASQLLEGYSEKWGGCKASGCGMDMGFHLAYNLSYNLYPIYNCLGDNCPSCDHVNNWKGPRGESVTHSDGYALRHRWM